jgi:hypothetical protein
MFFYISKTDTVVDLEYVPFFRPSWSLLIPEVTIHNTGFVAYKMVEKTNQSQYINEKLSWYRNNGINFIPRLMLYSDGVQVTNPLGGVKHKMFMLYMTLGTDEIRGLYFVLKINVFRPVSLPMIFSSLSQHPIIHTSGSIFLPNNFNNFE